MHATQITSSERERRLGELGPMVIRIGLAIGVVGLLISVLLGAFMDVERFFRSYLVAFIVTVTIPLGAMFFVMLQHVVRAGWSVLVRRVAEAVASNLRWIWVLFIPILAAVLFDWTHMYHWLHPAGDEVLLHKAPYFFWPGTWETTGGVPWFWILRAAIIFAVWALLANFFISRSIAQDATGEVNLTHQMQWWAPLGIIAYALTQSFASMDWLMSLEAHWFSTIYPVYFFAASATGALSSIILITYFLRRSGRMTEVTSEHFHDLGKLLFGLGIVFWAYIAYSQFMLQWYANIPETTGWVITRQLGGWAALSAFLLLGHFVGPFLLVISRHAKRAVGVLAVVAAWMLFMHFIDVYWLAMPIIPADQLYVAENMQRLRETVTNADIGYGWHVLDFMCVLSLLALLSAGTAWQLGRASLIPVRDPRLRESLAFENI
jgi:hypothetical protein